MNGGDTMGLWGIEATLKIAGHKEKNVLCANMIELFSIADLHNAKKIVIDGEVFVKNDSGQWVERG
jgi:hypothetical protein